MVKPKKLKNESIKEYNERASKIYYSNGYYIEEIAKKLNIDPIEVYNFITTGPKITTNSEREEMIKLHQQGYSYRSIGRMLNKSSKCVKLRIATPAKFNHMVVNKLSDRQIKKMRNMAENGECIEHISKKLKTKRTSIRNRLIHCGSSNTFTYVTEDEKAQFIDLFTKGETITYIAKMCNRHPATVSRHLHAAGYCRRKQK